MAIHKPAGFFALPPEMRNYMYKLSFEGTFTGVDVQPEYLIATDLAIPLKAPCNVRGLTGILNANKQARTEALGIFFATTTFFFTSEFYFLCWFRRLPSELRHAVTQVCLQIEITPSSRGDTSYDDRNTILSQMHENEMESWTEYLERKRSELGRSDFEPSVRFCGTAEGKVIWPKESPDEASEKST